MHRGSGLVGGERKENLHCSFVVSFVQAVYQADLAIHSETPDIAQDMHLGEPWRLCSTNREQRITYGVARRKGSVSPCPCGLIEGDGAALLR